MLKIKDNVGLKDLEKYKIYPVYNVDRRTGESYIDYFETSRIRFEGLRIVRKRKRLTDFGASKYYINKAFFDDYNIDLLYDLIKADLVEKVDNNV